MSTSEIVPQVQPCQSWKAGPPWSDGILDSENNLGLLLTLLGLLEV